MALVVGRAQVEAGRGVVREEQFSLQLGVDLYLPTDQGVFGREPSGKSFSLNFNLMAGVHNKYHILNDKC